jgi:molybdopterin adenylyltransferase
MRAAVVTVSTSRSVDGEDVSGPKLRELLEAAGCDVIAVEVIPDERELIAGRLRFYADEEGCELIATTGGTGLAPDDVTPEATRDVIDREAPGIAEAMRLASREHVPQHWFLSRGVAGIRNRALIVNFPGNPNAIEQAGAAITPSLEHALGLLRGGDARH